MLIYSVTMFLMYNQHWRQRGEEFMCPDATRNTELVTYWWFTLLAYGIWLFKTLHVKVIVYEKSCNVYYICRTFDKYFCSKFEAWKSFCRRIMMNIWCKTFWSNASVLLFRGLLLQLGTGLEITKSQMESQLTSLVLATRLRTR